MRPRRLAALLFAVAVLVAAAWVARPFVHGLSFVIREAERTGTARRLADFDTTPSQEREIEIPTAQGPLRARLYEPSRSRRRAALLVPGLHPAGIDEPRLVALARHLAASGLTIVTPDIPELSRPDIAPAIPDAIEQAALWLSSDSGLAPDGKVALMGISFGGGFAAAAAGRPSIAGRVAYVLSLGGHDDLPRVLRYLCTGLEARPGSQIHLKANATEQDPGAFVRPPNDQGVAVILIGLANRVLPPAQVEPMRAALRRFLWASHLDRVDKAQAEREFESLRELARHLPQPSATLLRYLNDHDVVHLGARLLPYVSAFGGNPALSPSRSPKPSAPVFLLHETDDDIIPAVESEYLVDELRGHTPVRVLLSGLVAPPTADRPMHVSEVVKLAGFWGDLLSR